MKPTPPNLAMPYRPAIFSLIYSLIVRRTAAEEFGDVENAFGSLAEGPTLFVEVKERPGRASVYSKGDGLLGSRTISGHC